MKLCDEAGIVEEERPGEGTLVCDACLKKFKRFQFAERNAAAKK